MSTNIYATADPDAMLSHAGQIVAMQGGIYSGSGMTFSGTWQGHRSCFLTVLLFCLGIIPGIIYVVLTGKSSVLTGSVSTVPEGGTVMTLTASGSQAKNTAALIIRAYQQGGAKITLS